jgi:cholesterol oxidase
MKNEIKEYDYVVIGSGFGGSVSALRLSEKGYKVLVIEKGKWFAKTDFPHSNWNLKKWLWLPSFNFYGIFKITMFKDVTVLSGTGVGGGSLVYANTLPRPKSHFFESGNWKGLVDWETELKPHYAEAERMLGAAKNPKFYDSDLALLEVAKSFGKDTEFEAANVSVFFGEPEKVVADPFFKGEGPEREGCSFCGGCMTGCRHNAKNSLDKNYLYLAQNKGAKIIAERLVKTVTPNGKADGSEGYLITHQSSTSFGKNTKTIKTKGVVFAGGVLGTVRLLLDMKKKKMLPNLSPVIGDHIRTNNENLALIVANKSSKDYSKGIAIGSIFPPNEDGHIESVRYRTGSGFWKIAILPMVFDKNAWIRIPKLLGKLIFQPWILFRALFAKDFAKQTVILLFMQHLDSTIKFKRGFWKMNSSMSSGVKATPFIKSAQKLANKTAEIINGKAFMMTTDLLTGAPSTAHILGGAVIAENAEKGVINTKHNVFGYKNMLVCDGSAISANPGVNPSLSITAMTERAMSMIPAKKTEKTQGVAMDSMEIN